MPGDGFSLAVRVGGQIDFPALLGRLFQIGDDILLPLDGLVVGHKALFNVYTDLALGQVPHMPHGRLYLIAGTKIFSNRLRLGRRLYNY